MGLSSGDICSAPERDSDFASDYIRAALIAVGPIGVGIKQNGVIMALQTANLIDFAGYPAEFSRGMAPGYCRKRIVRVENKIHNSIASPRESPTIPFNMLQ